MERKEKMSDFKEIIIFNDDETPVDFVTLLLNECFSIKEDEALNICQLIGDSGSYVIGSYPTKKAESLLESCLIKIKYAGHPLVVESRDTEALDKSAYICGFCGKSEINVKHMVAGKTSNICDGCINKSSKMLAEKNAITKHEFKHTHQLIDHHFNGINPDEILAVSRRYPARVRVDLQTALEDLLSNIATRLVGVHLQYGYDKVDLSALLETGRNAKKISPLQYEDVDIGEVSPKRCLLNGLWFLNKDEKPFIVLMGKDDPMYGPRGGDSRRVEVVCPAGEISQEFSQYIFSEIDKKISQASAYRGKALSLEQASQYSGESTGVKVHKLEAITGADVILSESTLKLIDRCVIKFSQQRELLRKHGQSSKRGVLLYGPPGTGKTHTIRYLASALQDHTTLLITAEQIGLLDEYMALARLLEPSMVVIEDVDLIAKDRNESGVCSQAILNQLLNEMDGLKEDSDILFILTTNRPEVLEDALAQRPGRVDQAIEIPLPDKDCRSRLLKLYGGSVKIHESVVELIVKKTEGVSAAFIKELIRRSLQISLDLRSTSEVEETDVVQALEEMLFSNNKLNTKLLGANNLKH